LYHSKLILGCYAKNDVSDPEIYITAIATVLSRYPADIGARLTDPKDGIAGKLKWLPTVSEIREAADEMQAADVAAEKRKADLAEQWRLREEFERYGAAQVRRYGESMLACFARMYRLYRARPAELCKEIERLGERWKIKYSSFVKLPAPVGNPNPFGCGG
jgi:hypothetical protein